MGYYDGSGSASGSGSDYGYLGGGMYVPTPYVPPAPKPKPVVKKKASNPYPPKGTGSSYDEQVPKQSNPYPPKGTGSAYDEQVPKKKAAQTATKKVAATYSGGSSSSGSGSSGSSESSGGSGAVAAPKAAAAAAPAAAPAAATPEVAPPPTTKDIVVPDASIDPTYQAAVTQLATQLANADTARKQAETGYDTSYNSTMKNLGYDPATQMYAGNDPTTQYGSAFRNNLEDYTSRGLGYSSDYLGDLNNLNRTFGNQVTQLGQQRTDFRTAQDQAYQNYAGTNEASKTQALIAATARIAASLGIDQSQVPTSGGSKTITVPLTSS